MFGCCHTNSSCLYVCLSSVMFVHLNVGFQFSRDTFVAWPSGVLHTTHCEDRSGKSPPPNKICVSLIHTKIMPPDVRRLKCTKFNFVLQTCPRPFIWIKGVIAVRKRRGRKRRERGKGREKRGRKRVSVPVLLHLQLEP